MNSLDDTSRNKDLIRTVHTRLLAERDSGVLDELIAPAVVPCVYGMRRHRDDTR